MSEIFNDGQRDTLTNTWKDTMTTKEVITKDPAIQPKSKIDVHQHFNVPHPPFRSNKTHVRKIDTAIG